MILGMIMIITERLIITYSTKRAIRVNEGSPIYSLPTWDFIRVHYYKGSLL
jgi:hypothetical protein